MGPGHKRWPQCLPHLPAMNLGKAMSPSGLFPHVAPHWVPSSWNAGQPARRGEQWPPRASLTRAITLPAPAQSSDIAETCSWGQEQALPSPPAPHTCRTAPEGRVVLPARLALTQYVVRAGKYCCMPARQPAPSPWVMHPRVIWAQLAHTCCGPPFPSSWGTG